MPSKIGNEIKLDTDDKFAFISFSSQEAQMGLVSGMATMEPPRERLNGNCLYVETVAFVTREEETIGYALLDVRRANQEDINRLNGGMSTLT